MGECPISRKRLDVTFEWPLNDKEVDMSRQTLGSYLEGLFKVVVFIQEHAIIDDNLRRRDAQLNNPIIDGFTRLSKHTDHVVTATHASQSRDGKSCQSKS